MGFNKILTLSLKELEITNHQIEPNNNLITESIDFEVLDKYILNSTYIKETHNFIGKGWVVYQYTGKLLEEFHSKNQYVVYSENGVIKGAILFSDVNYSNILWISFIEAENNSIYKELLNYVISRTLKKNCKKIQLLVPYNSKLIGFVNLFGFKSWEQDNDFLLYEMPLVLIKQITEV